MAISIKLQHNDTNEGCGKLNSAINCMKPFLKSTHTVCVDTVHIFHDGAHGWYLVKSNLEKHGIVHVRNASSKSFFQTVVTLQIFGSNVVLLANPKDGYNAYLVIFHPSKLGYENSAKLLQILDDVFQYFKKPHYTKITRLDVAYDIPYKSDQFYYHLKRAQHSRLYKKTTLYLGSRKSKVMACIYDKKKQLLEVKKIYCVGAPITRIELRIRKAIPLGELGAFNINQIFERLMVFEKEKILVPKHIPFAYAAFYKNLPKGFHVAIKKVSGTYRRKKIINQHSTAMPDWWDVDKLSKQFF